MRDIRGETLYFVLLDRFVDGDADSNGGTNPATHDPEHNDWQRYWGGDLQGVIDKLDYLEGLGVTTLVLSPVVEQIPSLGRDKGMMVAPFDGRWALDYRRLDPHLVPREEWGRPFGERDTVFDRLVSGCHRRGMRVLLQFVCNHSNPGGTGNPRGELHEDGSWLGSFEHDQHGLYRHGLARDTAALEGGEAGPAPFDPTSGRFRAWMRGVLKDWLGRGVDGFHFDHANQMPVWFWQELNSSLQRARPDAVLLGSWSNRGWDDAAFAYANRSGMRISDFGFQQQVLESLCWEGVGGFRRMAAYLERDEQLEDATSLLTSLDTSHSPRVLASGLRPDHLRIAVTMLMTARGVPWLLYGTEQGLRGGGDEEGEPFNLPMMERFESNGVTEAMWKLAALRRDNLAMQRGHFRLLWVNEDVLVFSRGHAEDTVVVALNRGREVSVELSEVPLPDGPVFDVLGGSGVLVKDRKIERLALSTGVAFVFARTMQCEATGCAVLSRLTGYRSRFGEMVVLTGDAPELGEWDISRAPRLQYANSNLWMGDVAFSASVGKALLYKYAVVDQRGGVLREDRMPRRRVAPVCQGIEWADRWGTEG